MIYSMFQYSAYKLYEHINKCKPSLNEKANKYVPMWARGIVD